MSPRTAPPSLMHLALKLGCSEPNAAAYVRRVDDPDVAAWARRAIEAWLDAGGSLDRDGRRRGAER